MVVRMKPFYLLAGASVLAAGALYSLHPWSAQTVTSNTATRIHFAAENQRSPRRFRARPQLIRLTSHGQPVYLWQAGAYHWIPQRALMQAMGYRYSEATWEASAPGPIGHPMTFYYHPGDKLGYWYHAGKLYPVVAYPESAWTDWGHTVSRLPFALATAVKILNNGRVVYVKSVVGSPIKAHPLTVFSDDGITFRYPSSWIPNTFSAYTFQAVGPKGQSSLDLSVYPQSDRSPSSPLWFLGKYRVLPYGAETWSNSQGGIDYQALVDNGDLTSLGVVQPIPSHQFGYAFRLQMTVLSSRVAWAWTVLDRWSLSGEANTALLTGDTNTDGDPTFRVTLVGPSGQITTTASLDTGNEGGILINPSLAQAIGLVQTGTVAQLGVSGQPHDQPLYKDLSVAPAGTSNWMLYQGTAEGWGLSGIDIGTGFLRYATETDSNGHWTITWVVQ